MRPRLPRIGWFVLATVVLTVSGVGFHFWWHYQVVCQLFSDVRAVHGQTEVKYWGPQWLERWVDKHAGYRKYFQFLTTQVIFVGIYEKGIDDSWATRLSTFRDLEFLNLTNSSVNRRGGSSS